MSSKAARTRSEPVTLPRLGLAGTLRWIWTQLTSMSTALMLLLLLAWVAKRVTRWMHPGPWL